MESFKIICLKCGETVTFKEIEVNSEFISIKGTIGSDASIYCDCGNKSECVN